MPNATGRHAIGAVVIDIVKFIKNYEKRTGKTLAFSDPTQACLRRRVSQSEWVPIQSFHELLSAVGRIAVRGDERRALEMGAAGGAAMRGVQKAYGVVGDPRASIIAMRHAWRAHYDFGRLTCESRADGAVLFAVEDYPDMPMVHGLMTAGWGIAAARAAGASHVDVTILERPWDGAPRLSYNIGF